MMHMHINFFNINEKINNNHSLLLVIENKKVLYNFLKELNDSDSYGELIKVFDEKERQVKKDNHIDFIPSPFLVDINNKKNISSLTKYIRNYYYEELKIQSKSINELIEGSFKKIRMDFQFSVNSEVSYNEEDLIKDMKITFDCNINNLLEGIINYIKVTNELRNIKCFIFYNLFDFLDIDEIDLLLKNAAYLDIKIINIENQDVNNPSFNKKYILDNDLCLIC